MNLNYLAAALTLILVPVSQVSGQIFLFNDAGATANFSGTNQTTFLPFETALPVGKSTLAEWEVGDKISLSFNLTFDGYTDNPTAPDSDGVGDGANVDFGFISSADAGSDSVAYAVLQPGADAGGNPSSSFRYRSGSMYMSASAPNNAAVLVGAPFDAGFMYVDDTTGGDYDISLSLTKAAAETYTFELDIDGQLFSETGLLTTGITQSAIDTFGFRESKADRFDNGLASDMVVTFSPIPEPSTTVLIFASLAFAGVLLRRKMIAGRPLAGDARV